MALARDQRADRQHLACWSARAGAARRVIGAGHHGADAAGGNVKARGEGIRRHRAGDDQTVQARQQALLDLFQPGLNGLAQAGFQRDGMMDQTGGAAGGERVLQSLERGQRETVDHRLRVRGQAVPRGAGGIARQVIGQGKHAGQFHHIHDVTGRAGLRDDAAVIAIAAGHGVERRRNDQRQVHGSLPWTFPMAPGYAGGPSVREKSPVRSCPR